MKIIFTVTGDKNETAISVDWPIVPRIGEVVKFDAGQYQGKELLVEKVVYSPMLSFIDIGNGADSHDGVLVTVALSTPNIAVASTPRQNKVVPCPVCGGTGCVGADLEMACANCDGCGEIVVEWVKGKS